MSKLIRNLARSRSTRPKFSHSSGKGMLLEDIVTSATPRESGELFKVLETATAKQSEVKIMDTDALDNAGYNVGNISEKGTDILVGWLNNTTNETFQDSTEANFNISEFFDCDIFNDSCLMSNSSNLTGTDPSPPGPAYWSLLLLIFPLFTVFGNVLVVLSIYRERTLRHVTNYFICSLAIADIMVAVVVMPPAVYVEVSDTVHILNILDTRKNCCNHPKIWTRWLYHTNMHPKGADGMANSVVLMHCLPRPICPNT